MIEQAGVSGLFDFIADVAHLGMPCLLQAGRRFDFVFVDGWHSFDFTFVEYFYADLLLREGGILAFDDADFPGIDLVCRFVETHKARLGPPMQSPLGVWPLLLNRVAARLGRPQVRRSWGNIQAYRKIRATVVPSDFHDAVSTGYTNVCAVFRFNHPSKGGLSLDGFAVRASAEVP